MNPLKAVSSLCIFSYLGVHTAFAGQQIEAENFLSGSSERIAFEAASGGGYAASGRNWEPLLQLNATQIPMDSETVTVWSRYRGVPIQLKTLDAEGKQHERNWSYSRPGNWAWKNLGTYQSSDFEHGFVIIRGKGAKPGAGLDAVWLSSDANSTPPGMNVGRPGEANAENAVIEATEPIVEDLPTEEVVIEIDWNQPTFPTSPAQFSTAVFSAFDPKVAANPRYHEMMEYLGASMVRYHNMAMMKDSKKKSVGWIDHENQSWDAEKIKAALTAWNPDGVTKMINIPEWPEWMDEDGNRFLDDDKIDDFAQWCAELVQIVNIDNNLNVEYWEITNELDGLYWLKQRKKGQPKRIEELAQIHARVAEQMKAVDPTIKTGGPAATRSDLTDDLETFTIAAGPNLDFLSFHAYASGKKTDSDRLIYSKADLIGKFVKDNRAMLDRISPDRRIEAHLNEYNIAWTWRTREPRMLNHKGAVFDALTFIELSENGIDVGNAWNERDGVYGKMSSDYELRPAAHVFHAFNRWLTGQAVEALSSDPMRIVTMAVDGSEGPAFVLVNHTNSDQIALLDPTALEPFGATVGLFQTNEAGLQEFEMKPVPDTINQVAIPPHSVTVLHNLANEIGDSE